MIGCGISHEGDSRWDSSVPRITGKCVSSVSFHPSHLLLALMGRCSDPHRKSLLSLANPLTINFQSFSLRSTIWSTFESCPISDRSNHTSTNLEETPPMSKRSRLLRERNLWSRIMMRWSMLRNTCLWVKRCLGQKLYRMFSLSLSLPSLPPDSETLEVIKSSFAK